MTNNPLTNATWFCIGAVGHELCRQFCWVVGEQGAAGADGQGLFDGQEGRDERFHSS